MKINRWLWFAPLVVGLNFSQAQEKKSLTIKEAVSMALNNSNVASLAKAKVNSAKEELQLSKNNQYPSLKVNAQWLHLSHVSMTSNLGSSSSDGKAPSPDQLYLGQANLTLPIFSGFILKNSVKASEKKYQAETFSAKYTQEQLAVKVIELFSALYKADQSEEIIANNVKSAQQRVKDFTAMEANGIIARNDLLKSQLQVHKLQLTLEETKKNRSLANYQLATLLKLPEGTDIAIDIDNIKSDIEKSLGKESEGTRNDLESAKLKQSAAETAIKIAKGNYYPSLALVGGYIGLNIKDVLKVNYAMNFGAGVSYDLANIFKNKANVRLAKSHNEEAKEQVAILGDQIKEEIHQAKENYELSIKQSKVYDEALTQSTENFRIVKDKFENGLVNTNDLLDAETDLLFVKINQTLTKVDIAQKFYELQFAQGKLINNLNISSN